VEVAFKTSARNVLDDLKGFSGVSEVNKQGDKFRLYTDNSPGVLTEVWDYSRRTVLFSEISIT